MKILIIPAAKVVDKELQQQVGNIPSASVPLYKKLLIDIIYEKYIDIIDKIYIVVFEKKEFIENYILKRGLNIELIELDKLNDIGYTIYFALREILMKYDNISNVFINFGDTLTDESLNFNNSFALYSETNDSKRWTTFTYEYHKIIDIYDKCELNKAQKNNSFIGVFNFTNVKLLKEILGEALLKQNNSKMDSFYYSLLEYSKLENVDIIKTIKWLDSGHFDKYNEAKNYVKPRYFNTIHIDTKKGILTKKSNDKEKFVNEINWYLKLPKQLQYIRPRILDYSTNEQNPFVSMEYYSYDTLHKLLVFNNLSIEKWREICNSLIFIIEEMKKYYIKVSNNEILNSINDMYVEKTIKRLNRLKENKKFEKFFQYNIIINGKVYKSLNYYKKIIKKLVKIYEIRDLDKFSIIHGDLCFSNILFDVKQNIVRLIDPRGSFGRYDIYGDFRYDLAKIAHSIEGKYDFIIEDLFYVYIKGTEIQYNIFTSQKHKEIEQLFIKEMNKYINDYTEIRLIESLLFLSMVPLHNDFPDRQYVMMAIGIQLLDSILEKGEQYDYSGKSNCVRY